MSPRPWLKFFTSDWRSEITLKMVSREARSLWLDIICLIHDGGEGRLHFDGANPTEKDLAQVLGDNPRTVRKLLGELEQAKVFSRDEHGFVVSRRIIRDLEKAEQDRSNGRMGGNPSLKNNRLEQNGVNPPDKAHIPEARCQIPEGSSETSDNIINVVPADAGPPSSKYAFEANTIKLSKRDLEQWRRNCPSIRLEAELMALDEWAGREKASGKNWFSAVSGALAKKEREAFERIQLRKLELTTPKPPTRQHIDGRI